MTTLPTRTTMTGKPGIYWGLLLLSLSWGVSANQDIHPEVRYALEWELPPNECAKPRLMAQSAKVVDGGGSDFLEGAGAMTDVDSYTIKRYERKKKRWEKCVDKYKSKLMKDFERLKNSAQHGLTQDQADQILANMATIQQAYLSPEGLDEEAASQAE